jgi:GT2 family glycosyltransferase
LTNITKTEIDTDIKFCALIVTFNRLTLLKECIDACLNQERPFDEIFIVDNHSTDDTEQYLESISEANEKIRFVTLASNVGGAGGFEYGLRNINQNMDWVMVMDDDAILDISCLKIMYPYVIKGDSLAYSTMVFRDGQIDLLHRRRIINKTFMRFREVERSEYKKDGFKFDMSTFCGLLISTKLFEKIGYPNGWYFIWHDDIEYSLRISSQTSILNINAAFLDHKTKASFKEFSWKTYYSSRNSVYLARVHSKHWQLCYIYRFTGYITVGVLAKLASLFAHDKTKYRQMSKMLFNVIKDVRHQRKGINEQYLPGKEMPV